LQYIVYFQEKGFVYVNTPITGSDAEGAGEMFKVTALPFDETPRTEDGKVNYKEDFFGKNNLTVSGQLEGETLPWLWARFILWTYV
jgi:asparaginyl-tRNA synthetase